MKLSLQSIFLFCAIFLFGDAVAGALLFPRQAVGNCSTETVTTTDTISRYVTKTEFKNIRATVTSSVTEYSTITFSDTCIPTPTTFLPPTYTTVTITETDTLIGTLTETVLSTITFSNITTIPVTTTETSFGTTTTTLPAVTVTRASTTTKQVTITSTYAPVCATVSAAPSPIQPGVVSYCKKYHLVTDDDDCWSLAGLYGISVPTFKSWNTQVGSDCHNLWTGYYCCVGI
ncbi:hypothetical protein BJ508DRAFT_377492 [Ascobolus immersus RN42]|uniref:LysM domain-containing protein n=1 Tax=Ascobolus immersus RN42 TaxID=1160509 RepID=A0A3N4I305_ASCIM|nr:hypothetical protein BJ508DRAFT_377492 [Ascobolus immersus RN42]